MFLQVSVILFWGGGGIPACIVGLQAHTREVGGVEGSGLGGSTGPHPGRGVEGSGLGGGFPRPHPGGGLQAHTWGVS